MGKAGMAGEGEETALWWLGLTGRGMQIAYLERGMLREQERLFRFMMRAYEHRFIQKTIRIEQCKSKSLPSYP